MMMLLTYWRYHRILQMSHLGRVIVFKAIN
jgi:hypothetical protein